MGKNTVFDYFTLCWRSCLCCNRHYHLNFICKSRNTEVIITRIEKDDKVGYRFKLLPCAYMDLYKTLFKVIFSVLTVIKSQIIIRLIGQHPPPDKAVRSFNRTAIYFGLISNLPETGSRPISFILRPVSAVWLLFLRRRLFAVLIVSGSS